MSIKRTAAWDTNYSKPAALSSRSGLSFGMRKLAKYSNNKHEYGSKVMHTDNFPAKYFYYVQETNTPSGQLAGYSEEIWNMEREIWDFRP